MQVVGPKMQKLGFGIIGCGFAGNIHAQAITSTKEGELVAVCDKDKEAVKSLATKYKIEWYTDLPTFLSRDDIQIVNICVPSSLHGDVAIQAAKAGKYLVVEKPLDVTVEKCDVIIEAARSAGVKLTVIFQNRFKEAVRALRKALEEGRFGKLILGEAFVRWHREPEYYEKGGWKGTKRYDGGGALINQGIHTIDLLQWMMGPVKDIHSKTRTLVHDIEVEDSAVAILEFENGALGVIEGATSIYPGLDECLGIYGEKGTVRIEGNRILTWEFKEEKEEDKQKRLIGREETSSVARGASGMSFKYHQAQIENLIQSIQNNQEPLINGEEAKKAVQIIQRIYLSGG